MLRPSQFADVQVNAALALAKKAGAPRDVAAKIVDALDLDGIADQVEVSGPGFINITLGDAWLASLLTGVDADERLGVPEVRSRRPSRSTTPRPMSPRRCTSATCGRPSSATPPPDRRAPRPQRHPAEPHRRLGHAVRHAHRAPARGWRGLARGGAARHRPQRVLPGRAVKFDTAERANLTAGQRVRHQVGPGRQAQSGDPETLEQWHRLVGMSKVYFNKVYTTLGVTLDDENLGGESDVQRHAR